MFYFYYDLTFFGFFCDSNSKTLLHNKTNGLNYVQQKISGNTDA